VDDAFGVSIFQFPSVTAYSGKLTGIDPVGISPTIFWNFWEWKIS
jgi:peptide/nickel transport system substrate-binding protein